MEEQGKKGETIKYLGTETNTDTLYDTGLRNKNRFLIRFYDYYLNEWHAEEISKPSVSFNGVKYEFVDDKLVIRLRCHYGDMELIDICAMFNDRHAEYITVEDLDRTGVSYNTEYYMNPQIVALEFDPCSYNIDEGKKCTIYIKFDDVQWEHITKHDNKEKTETT